MMLAMMVDAAERLCPHVMASGNLRQELLKAGAARMTVPHSFISSTLLDQSGMDIINKIRCAALLELQAPSDTRDILDLLLSPTVTSS